MPVLAAFLSLDLACLGFCGAEDPSLESAVTLYVALTGSDGWSGELPSPNAELTDGPFATLEKARNAIRRHRSFGRLPAGGITVFVRGGTYYRSETFLLDRAWPPREHRSEDEEHASEDDYLRGDGGTTECPIVYRAYPGEEVRISGGVPLAGFEPVSDPRVMSRLSQAAQGNVVQVDLKKNNIREYGHPMPTLWGISAFTPPLELFFEDRRMPRAGWPDDG